MTFSSPPMATSVITTPAISVKVPSDRLTEDGITPREVQRPMSTRELTEFQQAVLVGTLLGDGSIAKHGRHHRLFVKHKIAHRALAEWKREVFVNFTTMPLHQFDQRLNGHFYPCVQFVTRTDPVFSEWRYRFYEGRRKIVPAHIDSLVTPASIATWLMDDGTADRAGVSFQTHSFEIDEVRRLVEMLQLRFGISANVMRNKGRWIVYVPKASLGRLRSIVEGLVLPEFAYKLVPRGNWTP